MKRTWIVSSDSSIIYGFKSIPKEVIVAPSQIAIDSNIKIHITYGSKSSRPSIVRKPFDKDHILYLFYDKQDSSNHYMLIHNRKNPDEMILMMKKSEDVNGEELNLFILKRKEDN
ncbi:hypothetical protein [Enterococcus sp. DIV0800]|uniref:hypothetical protein n=1 Tax=unclassified Enterococcus TaxID=2608891 RepID=UPI003D2FFEA4